MLTSTHAMANGALRSGRACMTVDWEDFGQLYCWYRTQTVPPPRRDIERQTEIVLELLGDAGVKATFFCLGMLARHRPDLLRRIHAEGHEIAVHGTDHVQLTRLGVDAIRRDIVDSAHIVSDVIGSQVHGFRAPLFSITRGNLFVLDMLAELGFTYDSSIFPKDLVRYGIAGFDPQPRHYSLPRGGSLVELPLTVLPWGGMDWPVSGGGYMRLLPRRLLAPIAERAERMNRTFILYTHPYEFDSQTLDVASNMPDGIRFPPLQRAALNVRWNVLRQSFIEKIRFLLTQLRFVTCKDIADDLKTGQCTKLLE